MSISTSHRLDAHPLAEKYPLLEGDEFEAFKADISANGQSAKIVLFEGKILDGRNRYRACRELGIEPQFEEFHGTAEAAAVRADSLNFHRRHLTREQKRAVIAFKLAADPARSDRDIAAEVKVDHKTVAAVRREASSTGEIPHSDTATRRGRDGRRRPATQPRKTPTVATPQHKPTLSTRRDEPPTTALILNIMRAWNVELYELADLIGIDSTDIVRIIWGIDEVPFPVGLKLCIVLGVDPTALLGEDHNWRKWFEQWKRKKPGVMADWVERFRFDSPHWCLEAVKAGTCKPGPYAKENAAALDRPSPG